MLIWQSKTRAEVLAAVPRDDKNENVLESISRNLVGTDTIATPRVTREIWETAVSWHQKAQLMFYSLLL